MLSIVNRFHIRHQIPMIIKLFEALARRLYLRHFKLITVWTGQFLRVVSVVEQLLQRFPSLDLKGTTMRVRPERRKLLRKRVFSTG